MKINTVLIAGILFLLGNILAMNNSEFDKTMSSIVEHYLIIHNDLASDRSDNVREMALKIQDQAKHLDINDVEKTMMAQYEGIPEDLMENTKLLMKAENIEEMRIAFQDLSKPMARWASIHKPDDLNVVYCSMAPGSWLQKGGDIRNPYYGASMLKCGEIVSGNSMNMHKKEMDHNCENCDHKHQHHEMKSQDQVKHLKSKM